VEFSNRSGLSLDKINECGVLLLIILLKNHFLFYLKKKNSMSSKVIFQSQTTTISNQGAINHLEMEALEVVANKYLKIMPKFNNLKTIM